MLHTIALCCVAVCFVHSTYAVPLNTPDGSSMLTDGDQVPFSFEDMFDQRFSGASVQGDWFRDTNSLTYYDNSGNLVARDMDSNTVTVLVPSGTVDLGYTTYTISSDGNYVAFNYDFDWFTQEFSGVTKRVAVYDIDQGVLSDYPNDDDSRGEILYGFMWSNTGSGSLYVYNDDIYYQSSAQATPIRMTSSGEGGEGQVRNGYWFWNDNFGRNPASTFSPDDEYLVIGESRFSDDFPASGQPIYGDVTSAYYSMYMQNYVKASPDYFSETYLYLVNMSNPQGPRHELLPPEILRGTEYYNQHISWLDEHRVAVTWGNRAQNQQYLLIYDIITGQVHQNFHEEVEGGWNHNLNMLRLFDGGDLYASILSRDVGDLGGYKQVAVVNVQAPDEGEITYLTSRSADVWWIVGTDSSNGHVYFTGVYENPTDRHLFRVTIPVEGSPVDDPVCMTCDMAPSCNFVSSSFSASTEYYLLTCLGPDVPKYYIRSTTSELDFLIEDNAELTALLATRQMPRYEYMSIEFEPGYVGWAQIVYPAEPTPGHQYPVLLYPYNGPQNAQQAQQTYQGAGFFWGGYQNYLASTEGVVTIRIDGRGSGMHGDRYMYSVYKRLGELETRDQIYGVQDIITRFEGADLDPTRIAVYGHSYGGFMAGSILSDPSDVVTCGLASAPVTSWRWYSAIWTERYLGIDSPEDNEEGYTNSDLFNLNKVEQLRGKHLMITHGTHDDNVHAQHSFQWMKVLVQEDMDFISYIYTDENHGIANVQHHEARVYTNMMLRQCFNM